MVKLYAESWGKTPVAESADLIRGIYPEPEIAKCIPLNLWGWAVLSQGLGAEALWESLKHFREVVSSETGSLQELKCWDLTSCMSVI